MNCETIAQFMQFFAIMMKVGILFFLLLLFILMYNLKIFIINSFEDLFISYEINIIAPFHHTKTSV